MLHTCEMYFARSNPKCVLSCSMAAADEGRTSLLKRHCAFSPLSSSSSASDSHEASLSWSSHMGVTPSWSLLIPKSAVSEATKVAEFVVL